MRFRDGRGSVGCRERRFRYGALRRVSREGVGNRGFGMNRRAHREKRPKNRHYAGIRREIRFTFEKRLGIGLPKWSPYEKKKDRKDPSFL